MSAVHPARPISHEKLEQAATVLREQELDCWLLLGRETAELCDPTLALLLDTSVTWTSAFLVTAGGRRLAIVGRYDVENVRAEGGFDEVVGYDEDLKEPLLGALEVLDPRTIGLNDSVANHTSDGLTHGLYLHLQAMLEGTRFAGRLRSADAVASAVRARKSPQELERIRTAIGTAQAIFDGVTGYLRPGLTERQVHDFVRAEVGRRGVTPAWDARYCPTLNAGPRSPEGHAQATGTAVEAGHWFHMDRRRGVAVAPPDGADSDLIAGAPHVPPLRVEPTTADLEPPTRPGSSAGPAHRGRRPGQAAGVRPADHRGHGLRVVA